MSVATVPQQAMSADQMQAMLASLQAMLGQQAKPIGKPAKSRDKATQREEKGLEPRDVSKLDQQLATDRDVLIRDGHRILGTGMTMERINYAMRVVSWARATSAKESESSVWEGINGIGLSVIHAGNDQVARVNGEKKITLPILKECVKLAALATYCKGVAELDFYVAVMFNRFLGKKFKVLHPQVQQLEACKAIVARILSHDAALMKDNGFTPCRDAIRAAIDDVLGARARPEKTETSDNPDEVPESGVTSVHAVANWLAVASDDDMRKLAAMLSDDVKVRFVGIC